jgi:orotidine-5'-phosphate decarboxylase
MTAEPLDRLRDRIDRVGAPLCVGIDPHPRALPHDLARDVRGVEAFARGVIEATAPHAAAVKLNVAFFEAFGSAGWAALERVRRDIPPQLVCIVDAKRGDIGSTAERYAEALFGVLDADGTTLSPYLGEDAIEPFFAWSGRLLYVLARTTNPSAALFQDLMVGDEKLHVRVAAWVAERWPQGRVGLVVGATAPEELLALRERVPEPAFLIPGVGAQGGDLTAATRACNGARGPGLVAISRAIASASRGADWLTAAATAAESTNRSLGQAVLHSPPTAAHIVEQGGG